MLPLFLGDAVLRPLLPEALLSGSQSASMACVLSVDFSATLPANPGLKRKDSESKGISPSLRNSRFLTYLYFRFIFAFQ